MSDALAWLKRQNEIDNAELKAWRSRHPSEALSVREEARAGVEGRQPNYPPQKRMGARPDER